MDWSIQDTGRGLDFLRTQRGMTRDVRKLYTAASISTVPLLNDVMWAIKSVMRTYKVKDITYWASIASQWQVLIRINDIVRTASDKARKGEPANDTHVCGITWEDLDPAQNGGCKTLIRRRLKPSKTDQKRKEIVLEDVPSR